MTSKEKAQIDTMTYAEMLRLFRCAPAGEPLFLRGTFEYFRAKMAEHEPDHAERVRISKEVGWGQC